MKTRELVLAALFIAIVYLATAHLRIPSPDVTGAGQVHTGTAVVFIVSIVFGAKMGAISSFGMVLFNLTWGLVPWAPINLISRPIMAFIFAKIAHSGGAGGKKLPRNILAALVGGVWLVATMYAGQIIMFGVPWVIPAAFIPNNIAQIVLAIVLGLPMIRVLQKYKFNDHPAPKHTPPKSED
ncbi:MAG: ECF transporter S component [Defluviitaleaceae bacterium]|nr:ECF transporter S component [Defluviitaleaceae bacterium]